MLDKTWIPYGCYWSSPFVRWQGSFADSHSMQLAAYTARQAFESRGLDPAVFTDIYLGMTIPALQSFYGAPWLAGMIGAPGITGPSINQACATGVRVMQSAAHQIESEADRVAIAITCDRTSNGPHLLYPNRFGPGGRGDAEDWVWDNFGCDPWAQNSMLDTAENVAKESGISREQQDEIVLMRYAQYERSLADDRAFHRRYMMIPFEVKNPSGRKTLATVEGDEGIFPTSAEGLAKLRPVMKDGTVTFGGQTYPADGNCGMVLTTRERARELRRDHGIEVQVLGFGAARAKKGFMAQATVPAAQRALESAGVGWGDIKSTKTHNPFAVNDAYFSRETGVALADVNDYGSSLIFGHPQGPTGMRLTIELIEELALEGGGTGLMTGCAAGDTAAAVVVRVTG